MFKQKNNSLIELLEPIRNRLFYHFTITKLMTSLLYTLAGCVLFLFISRLLPIPFFREWVFMFLGVSILGTLIYAWLKKPHYIQAAKVADQYELQEKVITAYEHLEHHSPMIERQREDAVKHLRLKLPHILSGIKLFSIKKSQTMILSGLGIGLFLLLYIPNPMDEVILAQQEAQEAIAEVEEQIEKEVNKTKDNTKMDKQKKEELVKELEELKKELNESETVQEQLAKIKEAEKKAGSIKAGSHTKTRSDEAAPGIC